MIRRAGWTLVFVFLGFASLPLVDDLHHWLCTHIAGFCRRYAGPCPGLDFCSTELFKGALIIAIYLGPALAFGLSAFVFSRRSRPVLSWLFLSVSLITAHALVMTVFLQLSSK
jgi:hypothetical protein